MQKGDHGERVRGIVSQQGQLIGTAVSHSACVGRGLRNGWCQGQQMGSYIHVQKPRSEVLIGRWWMLLSWTANGFTGTSEAAECRTFLKEDNLRQEPQVRGYCHQSTK